jgi:hypothetical protein
MKLGDRHNERIYRLTYAGRTATLAALPYWEGAQQRLSSALGEDKWQALLQLLDEVCSAAKKAEQIRAKNSFPPLKRASEFNPAQNQVFADSGPTDLLAVD